MAWPFHRFQCCGGVCRFVGPKLPVSGVAYRNLELAMPELTPQQRRQIVHGVWENLGRTVGELPHIAALQENTSSGPGFEVQGAEYLEEQARKGGSVLFVSGHIGNWEMLPPEWPDMAHLLPLSIVPQAIR